MPGTGETVRRGTDPAVSAAVNDGLAVNVYGGGAAEGLGGGYQGAPLSRLGGLRQRSEHKARTRGDDRVIHDDRDGPRCASELGHGARDGRAVGAHEPLHNGGGVDGAEVAVHLAAAVLDEIHRNGAAVRRSGEVGRVKHGPPAGERRRLLARGNGAPNRVTVDRACPSSEYVGVVAQPKAMER